MNDDDELPARDPRDGSRSIDYSEGTPAQHGFPESRALDTFHRAAVPCTPKQGTPLSQCPTNLDLSTPRGKALLTMVSGETYWKPKPEQPVRFIARHWAMVPESRVNEKTGEVSEFVAVCMWDEAGTMFKSSGVASPFRLMAMLQLYSPSEWEQGIPIIVRAIPKSGRAPMHSIEIDLERL